ncbi:MAG: class I SAM-dependent methyltransferase [Bacteroidales bacterium]
MVDIFYEIFSDLPRARPWKSNLYTRAAKLAKAIPMEPMILDVGCGTGKQTMELANYFGGKIVALDNHEPFLNILNKKAKTLGYNKLISTMNCDMGNMPFTDKSFDLIWAEGSIFIIGFKKGLHDWKRLLKEKAYLAISEISWLKNNPPHELKEFFGKEYPGMSSIDQNVQMIKDEGYKLLDYFVLAPIAWWEDYYIPLEKRLESLRKKYFENESELELIEFVQLEIDFYRKYPDVYGYVFYIMQNS